MLDISVRHSAFHFKDPIVSESEIFLFLGTPLRALQYRCVLFLWALIRSKSGNQRTAEAASKSRGKSCTSLESDF